MLDPAALINRNRDQSDAVPFQNDSGEEMPAFGCFKVASYGSPVYSAEKPDGTGNLFYANAMLVVADGDRSTALLWNRPRQVLLDGSAVGAVVGPVAASWEMTSAGSGFVVLRAAISSVGVVERIGGEAGEAPAGGGGGGCCVCVCVTDGDILVAGIETVSQWKVVFIADHADAEGQTYGTLFVPLGEYILEYDSGLGYWTLDVTADITAEYLDETDATADLEADVTGELRFEHDNGGYVLFSVILTGTVPNPLQSFSDDFSSEWE